MMSTSYDIVIISAYMRCFIRPLGGRRRIVGPPAKEWDHPWTPPHNYALHVSSVRGQKQVSGCTRSVATDHKEQETHPSHQAHTAYLAHPRHVSTYAARSITQSSASACPFSGPSDRTQCAKGSGSTEGEIGQHHHVHEAMRRM